MYSINICTQGVALKDSRNETKGSIIIKIATPAIFSCRYEYGWTGNMSFSKNKNIFPSHLSSQKYA